MKQRYRLRVEDKPGVLMRVAGIITAKGANITSLLLRPTPEEPGFALIEIETELEDRYRTRVLNEMNRLVQVIEAAFLAGDQSTVMAEECR